ncbi:hypothetical protein BA011_40800 (plasmid) [Rhizobium leguminosarum]|uniref:Uncharacterized protein n=1 Tax=Rhizobium leguminosarum TaxID=384 RepID=A0A1B1CKF5_RHILE|nr:hypothetical protein BA011_40800 [Rhizobium leguminosarum]
MSIKDNGVAPATNASADIGPVTVRTSAKTGDRMVGTSCKQVDHTMLICGGTLQVPTFGISRIARRHPILCTEHAGS